MGRVLADFKRDRTPPKRPTSTPGGGDTTDRDQASANHVRFRADLGFQVPGDVPTRSRFPAPSEHTDGLITRS